MYFDHHLRLEPRQPQRDFDRGVAAEVADPVWFLGRQWQLGELQGEDAGSPVRVRATVARRRLDPVGGDPRWDPTRVPPEAIIESEPGDWWTIGRRIRYGARFRAFVDAAALPAECYLRRPPPGSRAYGTDLPAPYDAFSSDADGVGYLDGWQLWRRRAELGIPEAPFAEIPAVEPDDAWLPDQLCYQAEFRCAEHTFTVERHDGGRVDWYTVDGDRPFAEAAAEPVAGTVSVFPAQLTYPGAPHARYWQIEDAAVDLGGYPPDRSHFASMLLTDLLSTHGTEWFLFPIDTEAGHAVTLQAVTVLDGFGEEWSSAASPELAPPTDWSLFRTDQAEGADFNTLLVWPTAVGPLSGAVLEEVILGVDEYSNLLWAVERRVNSRDVRTPSVEERGGLPLPPRADPVNVPVQDYRYLLGSDAVPYWHPYQLDEFEGRRRFLQSRLVDYTGAEAALMEPEPAARLLTDPRLGGAQPVHAIDPATVPVGGLVLRRRWQLARATDGQPVLWVGRERSPLLAPPARHLRFDVMQPR
ncbi:hypothetical protein GCM10009841_28990 [Microlunatus panaciterrae]|uniref:DUF2169 domain-containing protein n=1 Tax=Microlunatus panaciterrae TaxID=400768 RepID=A0ABS2REY6_9ACTN|nr:hypothetical protein [Microlunatus panaciterrae]MBM7797559.1 hypothetical protein [Microlunatus panaciterrae]